MSSRISKLHLADAIVALGLSAASVLFIATIVGRAQDQSASNDNSRRQRFEVSSTTFSDGGALPLSVVFDQCAAYPGGGNRSPELSWTNAPRRTESFAVVMYDITASFSHWGMYDIDPGTTELPENAGVPDSAFGLQTHNDFGRLNVHYDGPCPPTTLNPPVHQYLFTVYALGSTLTLPEFPDFPPGPEALFRALIQAGRRRHILASASISGFFPGR